MDAAEGVAMMLGVQWWIFACVMTAAMLGGCGHANGSDAKVVYREGSDGNLMTAYDRESGCWYVLNGHGITPRLGADGKPMCGGAK
ncbi:hypothetical protein D7207_01625 [Burkholderia cepacia]|nr:hypothetical protein [Burkholderia cepacia]MBA9990693.1 hypothetical protein [Burkholderia cepacia]MBB0014558.1 hypothetical protein [Burkholderia cepacia]MBB0050788.1 hypothetical protein [Burkholderia cepacia]MBB0051239.1 hypothetical protein [Burkholderia cepacia]